jgi:Na+:H+ antiporter, NhaA family
MATDIAFALGMLSILGSRVPPSLKVFLTALAVMDDLAAVVVIAVFYSTNLSLADLAAAGGVFAFLVALNRLWVMPLWPYLIGGVIMWALMMRSGVHPTISGVLLAFAIPFTSRAEDERSPSHRLDEALHRPVAFVILPLFALANAGIVIGADWLAERSQANSVGILLGLVVGKPIGIVAASALAVALGVSSLPGDMKWAHLARAGLLGGIGFTMSIFITNLAFPGMPDIVNASKMAILVASVASAMLGLAWLGMPGRNSQPK